MEDFALSPIDLDNMTDERFILLIKQHGWLIEERKKLKKNGR
jgi:hypothetical protein